MQILPPLSLYIHLPWCIKKCPYCDFNSHALKDPLPENQYIMALLQDLRTDLPYVAGRPIKSIFFGGGTPSLFSASSFHHLLTDIQKQVDFAPEIEITLEANPGTLEHKDFSAYRDAGISRISLGAQSFQDEKLKSLGRIHCSDEIRRGIEKIQAAQFKSFNIDIMYGLPNQSVEDALYDLTEALKFSPPHLSWYNLTLEPNTLFYARPPVLPEEGVQADMFEAGQEYLQQHFKHYEVSAFAHPNHQCQHNLNYWQFGDYLGIGAGAHGKITLTTGDIIRSTKARHPKVYLADPAPSLTVISKIQLPFEFMLNALRLMDGFPFSLFTQRTGLAIASIQTTLLKAQDKGLLLMSTTHVSLTDLGKRYLNEVMELFLP